MAIKAGQLKERADYQAYILDASKKAAKKEEEK